MSQAETTFHSDESGRKPRVNWRRTFIIGAFAAVIGVAGYWGFQAYTSDSQAGEITTAATTAMVTQPAGAQMPSAPVLMEAAASATDAEAVATTVETQVAATSTSDVSADVLTYVSVPAIAGVDGAQLWGADGILVATLESGAILAATERTSDSTWLAVESASGTGWAQVDELIVFGMDALSVASLPQSVLLATAPQALPAALHLVQVPATHAEESTGVAAESVDGAVATPATSDAAESTLQTVVTTETSTLTAIVATGGDRLNVRAGPGPSFAVVAKVDDGTDLTVVGRNTAGDWLQVQVPDAPNELGWVATDYMRVSDPAIPAPVTIV